MAINISFKPTEPRRCIYCLDAEEFDLIDDEGCCLICRDSLESNKVHEEEYPDALKFLYPDEQADDLNIFYSELMCSLSKSINLKMGKF